MGQMTFTSDFYAIPLGGYEAILGVQWLTQVSPIGFDFSKREISIHWQGAKLYLQQPPTPTPDMQVVLDHKTINPSREQACFLVQLSALEVVPEASIPLPTTVQPLIEEFTDVFTAPTSLPPHRKEDHMIPIMEGCKPVHSNPYKCPYLQRVEIEKMVREMLDNGIIRHSQSPYASPVLLVKKRDNTWRFCVDYRALNAITIKNRFPIPLIEELMDELFGSKLFSKLDLRSGYHQIRVQEKDIHKTAFKTQLGHFEFIVMPFGLTNAPATFQGVMNEFFHDFIGQFVCVFFDDILIYSKDLDSHLLHLRLVLQRLRENHLSVKQSKCAFCQTNIEYLGHIISGQGVSADPSKISAMTDWPTPTNFKSLRGFLGLTGYYRRFVRFYGTLSKPLTNLLKKGAFQWTPEADNAFSILKQAMCSTPVLALPDFTKTFIVETDACKSGVGAELMQEGRPIAFFSKAISQRDLGLSTYEKELLAVVMSVQKWRGYLLGKQFIIRTDQQALKHLLTQKITTLVQQKWLTKLLGFDYSIEYKVGRENLVADPLSRFYEGQDNTNSSQLSAISVIIPQWKSDLKDSWAQDPFIEPILAQLAINPNQVQDFTLTNGDLRYKDRLYVGSLGNLCSAIITNLHASKEGGHSGINATVKRITNIFGGLPLLRMSLPLSSPATPANVSRQSI